MKLDFWNTFFIQPQIRNETKFHESFIVDMREAFYIQTSPMRYFEFENQPPPVGTKIKVYFHIRYRFPWVCRWCWWWSFWKIIIHQHYVPHISSPATTLHSKNYFFINFMLQSHATYHIKDFVITLAHFSSTQHEKSEGIIIGSLNEFIDLVLGIWLLEL